MIEYAACFGVGLLVGGFAVMSADNARYQNLLKDHVSLQLRYNNVKKSSYGLARRLTQISKELKSFKE